MKKIILTLAFLSVFGATCLADDGDMPNGSKCYVTAGCTGSFANPNIPGDEKDGAGVGLDQSSADLFMIFVNKVKDGFLYLTNN